MKKMGMYLTAIIFLALAACGGGGDAFVWDETRDNPFYGESISIAVLYSTPELRQFARIFTSQNPGSNIELVPLAGPGDGLLGMNADFDLLRDRLAVQIMAGQGPTVMDARFVNFRNRAFFACWLPLIDAHPRFNDDEWFMHVFCALTENGELLVFPEFIDFHYVAGNIHLPELQRDMAGMETVTVSELVQLYNRHGEADSGYSLLRSDNVIWSNVWFSDEFVDFGTGFVDFMNPGFVGLLEDAFRIMKPVPDSVWAEIARTGSSLGFYLKTNYFMFDIAVPLNPLPHGVVDGNLGFAEPMLLVNDEGEMIVSTWPAAQGRWVLSTGATSTQQAMALEFIRLTQDTSIHEVLNVHRNSWMHWQVSMPLSRARFDYHVERRLNLFLQNEGGEFPRIHTDREFIATETARLYAAMNRPMAAMPSVPAGIYGFFGELLERMHLGLVSPEDAAMQLYNRTVIEMLEGN